MKDVLKTRSLFIFVDIWKLSPPTDWRDDTFYPDFIHFTFYFLHLLFIPRSKKSSLLRTTNRYINKYL